jgi:hypothetical protein
VKQHTYRAALGLLVAATTVGIAVVFASHFSQARSVPGVARPPLPLLPYPVLVVLLVATGLLVAIAAGRFLVALVRDPGRTRRKGIGETAIVVLGMFLTLAVVFLVSALILSFMDPPDEPESVVLGRGDGEAEETLPPEEFPAEEPDAPDAEPGSTERSALLVVLLAALAAVAAATTGFLAWRRYSSRPEPDESERLERLAADLHRATGRGLEQMLAEPDHRRAVIAAYALVEQTLERHGFRHDRGQTPTEFVRAVLEQVAARSRSARGDDRPQFHEASREALVGLTRVYEIAKFSEHPIGERDRALAVACLEEVASTVASTDARDAGGGA